MDFANRGVRPNSTQQPQPSTENRQLRTKRSRLDFNKLSSITMLVMASLLAFALVIGVIFIKDGSSLESELIKTDKYQAVFLDSQDGQVYFGKLSVYNRDLYKLQDIYYVRVENPIQPEGANQQQQPNISLAKLGSELHGPEDTMYISRDKVLYWENLKDEGQVVTAISEFKRNGGETNAQTTQPSADQSQAAPGQNSNNAEQTQQPQ